METWIIIQLNPSIFGNQMGLLLQDICCLDKYIAQVTLARLLNPSDYGIVGVCTSIIAFNGYFSGGRGRCLCTDPEKKIMRNDNIIMH